MNAKLVIDLAFGDGGKGVLTDNLCDQAKGKTVVVRFSGGHNAGHTVIRDGVKHVFSSFGAGTLKGCPSFFTEDTAFYLPNLFNELEILKGKGVTPDLTIHPLAHMTTPYDVAFNRTIEGRNKHGSCGAGLSATMKRNIETPHKLFAVDLLYPELLKQKLAQIDMYYSRLLWDNPNFPEMMYRAYRTRVEDTEEYFFALMQEETPFKISELSKNFHNYIFEGSQGIMLDMDHGIFPNVTYANTTSKNAIKYVKRFGLAPEIFYVTRCYSTRHGNGWMPNENAPELINTEEEINVYNEWQTNFRTGEIDYDLLNQAIRFDRLYHEDYIRTNLVMGCMDQRPDFDPAFYKFEDIDYFWINDSPHAGNLKD